MAASPQIPVISLVVLSQIPTLPYLSIVQPVYLVPKTANFATLFLSSATQLLVRLRKFENVSG
jgi:hypothetical protein